MASAGAARADGLIIVDRPVEVEHLHWQAPPRHHPHWVPPRPIQQFLPLEVRHHRVEVAVEGQVATTSVDQVFFNPAARAVEGTYLFPVPTDAQIDRFRMEIDGKPVEAELLDAGKARAIYEEIVRKAKDPALMEYAGQKLFKVRIFPIGAREEKRVTLAYTQLLAKDGTRVSYRYPLNTEKFSSRPVGETVVKVAVKADVPVKGVYSPSHEIDVTRKGKRRIVAGFEERESRPDRDFELIWSLEPADRRPIGLELLAHREAGADGEGFFLMMVSPGVWEGEDGPVPKDVVFVADTSGSMRGEQIEQARRALAQCIDALSPEDRFEVIRFSTEADPVFGKLVEASPKNRSRARERVESFRAAGGTAFAEALEGAVALAAPGGGRDKAPGGEDAVGSARPFQVIFLTDGRPTLGETDDDRILASLREKMGSRAGAVRIFSFGIGTQVNTHLLDRIAETTRAAAEYIFPDEKIDAKVAGFFGKVAHPVLAGLELEAHGAGLRLSKRYPKDLPDLFKGDQLVVAGRYRADALPADATLTLSGWLRGRRQVFEYEVRFPEDDRRHPFVPRLWATRRVGYLLDEIRLRGEEDELKEEVARLARQFNIVTPYTSFLILEDEERRGVPMASRSLPFSEEQLDRFGTEYRAFREQKEGATAVAGAQSSLELKRASAAEAAGRRATDYSIRLHAAPGADGAPGAGGFDAIGGGAAAKAVADDALRQRADSQFVSGKTFYRDGARWIDGDAQSVAVESAPSAEVVEVEFGSDAYFELLARHPESVRWFAVAPEVRVVIDGRIYDVRERKG